MSKTLLVASLIAALAGCAVEPEDDTATLPTDDDTDIGDVNVGDGIDEIADSAGTPSVVYATVNLVKNSSFETGTTAPYSPPAYWMLNGYGYAFQQRLTDAAYSGSYGLRITSGPGVTPTSSAGQMIPAIGGRYYTVSAMTRRRIGGSDDQGDQQMMEVRFYKGYAWIATRRVMTGTSRDWHKLTTTLMAPWEATNLQVMVGDCGDYPLYGSMHDWDAISVIAN